MDIVCSRCYCCWSMLVNALEQALNVLQEDVQELVEELLSEHGLISRSTSMVDNAVMLEVSVPSSTEDS